MNIGTLKKMVPSVKRAVKKLEKTFEGDSNDAEHDAAVALVDLVQQLLLEIQPKLTPAERAREEAIREEAAGYTLLSEGELEMDDEALISEGDDNGAYVQTWMWVDFGGTKLCKGDDGKHDDCSEGCPVFDKAVEAA